MLDGRGFHIGCLAAFPGTDRGARREEPMVREAKSGTQCVPRSICCPSGPKGQPC